jgi:hypothetical protein
VKDALPERDTFQSTAAPAFFSSSSRNWRPGSPSSSAFSVAGFRRLSGVTGSPVFHFAAPDGYEDPGIARVEPSA